MPNKTIRDIDPDQPLDPQLAVTGGDPELTEGDVRLMIDRVQRLVSTNYQYLPVFVQSGLLSMIQLGFTGNADYLFLPDDPEHSRIVITRDWRRDTTARDTKPVIVVSVVGATANPIATGDSMAGLGVNDPRVESRSVQDNMTFRISVLHVNSALALVLAQTVRATIAVNRRKMQNYFKLQQVGLPSLSGPTADEEYDDLFRCEVMLEVVAMPRWTEREDPTYIKKLLVQMQVNAGSLLQSMLLPSDG